MRKWIVLVALLCSEVMAQSKPVVIGTIRNRAQGEITLTSEICSADTTMNFVFVRNDGGKLSLTGCWRLVDYNILVKWSDGDVYSYPVENLEFTPEYNDWYQKNKTRSQRDPNMY